MTTFHRELGLLVWDKCGMARDAQGLQEAIQKILGHAHRVLGECERSGRRRGI